MMTPTSGAVAPQVPALPPRSGPGLRVGDPAAGGVEGLAAQANPRAGDPSAAAQEFEALLIGQLLRSAHASEESEDKTGDTMWDMAAQQFSRVLAGNGGLGLTRLLLQGLKAPQTSPAPESPADSQR